MTDGRTNERTKVPLCSTGLYPLRGRCPKTAKIVAKALDGQRYPLPLCEYMWVCDGKRGSGPEEADDLCLVSFEALGLNLSINDGIQALRL